MSINEKLTKASNQYKMANHETIVALETFFCPIPSLSLPCPYTLHTYDRTAASEINERIAHATVLIVTTLPVRADDKNQG